MAYKSIHTKKAEVTEAMNAMVSRAGDLRGYFNRVLYDEYKLLQIKRWQKYNNDKAFTGGKWKELNESYAKWKARKFKSYPYQGKRIGIRTGHLFQAAVGEKKGTKWHRKLVKPRSIRIFIDLDYAKYFDKDRPITTYSEGTMKRLRRGIANYIRTGKQ